MFHHACHKYENLVEIYTEALASNPKNDQPGEVRDGKTSVK